MTSAQPEGLWQKHHCEQPISCYTDLPFGSSCESCGCFSQNFRCKPSILIQAVESSRHSAAGHCGLLLHVPRFLFGKLSLTCFCLNLLEHRGPPSGTNSAKQSPAPQHRPLGSAQMNPSSTDRYRAFVFGKRN